MREIKFRAWDELTKTMVGWDFKENEMFWTYVEEMPVMQYTGLKDKNGKDIYEGDIVNYGDNFPSLVIWDLYSGGETPGFWLEERGSYDYPRFHTMTAYTSPIEVIGNIYENPELIQLCKN